LVKAADKRHARRARAERHDDRADPTSWQESRRRTPTRTPVTVSVPDREGQGGMTGLSVRARMRVRVYDILYVCACASAYACPCMYVCVCTGARSLGRVPERGAHALQHQVGRDLH
jgi:hypothetical protein